MGWVWDTVPLPILLMVTLSDTTFTQPRMLQQIFMFSFSNSPVRSNMETGSIKLVCSKRLFSYIILIYIYIYIYIYIFKIYGYF